MRRIALCQRLLVDKICLMTTIPVVIAAVDVICNTVVADSIAARIAVDCQN